MTPLRWCIADYLTAIQPSATLSRDRVRQFLEVLGCTPVVRQPLVQAGATLVKDLQRERFSGS
jgi:hypothetical protein